MASFQSLIGIGISDFASKTLNALSVRMGGVKTAASEMQAAMGKAAPGMNLDAANNDLLKLRKSYVDLVKAGKTEAAEGLLPQIKKLENELKAGGAVTSMKTLRSELLQLKAAQANTVDPAQFKGNLAEIGQQIPGVSNVMNIMANPLGGLVTGLTAVGSVMASSWQSGMKYQDSLADLSAITGVSGAGLAKMGENAKTMAADFGGDAVSSIDAFKNILSVLGPELAQNPAALDNMGRHVMTLSKTMGGDAVGAANALTGAMSQYSVDLTDPIKASAEMGKMMNVMAAGAQVGAAEVPDIAASIKVAGAMAKNAGVSFEELNGGIQVLSTKGIKGAEAGTALRNIMVKLNEGRFLPKETSKQLEAAGIDIKKLGDTTVPLSERLKQLQKIQGDSALVAKLFGSENVVAGSALLSNIPMLEEYTKKVTGTNSAQDQARIYMGTFSEQFKRLQARFDNFKLGLFEKMAPVVTAGMNAAGAAIGWVIDNSSTLLNVMTAVGIGLGVYAAATAGASAVTAIMATISTVRNLSVLSFIPAAAAASGVTTLWGAAQWALNAAIMANPIGAIIAGVAALAGGIYFLYTQFQPVRSAISGFGAAALAVFSSIGNTVMQIFGGVKDTIVGIFTMDMDLMAKGLKDTVMGIAKATPIGMIYSAGKDAKDAFKKGYDEKTKTDEAEKKAEAKTKKEEKPKLLFPTVPGGMVNMAAPVPGMAGGAGVNGSGKKELNVETDAGKSRNLTINIDRLVEAVNITMSNFTEDAASLKEKITQVFVDAVRDGELTLSAG